MELGEPVAPPAVPPAVKSDPRIVAVLILHGDDESAGVGGGTQFVNLPMDAKWVDGAHVLNKQRLGPKVRIKVKFDQPGSHSFKIKLVPDAGNSVYSGGEKGRNANFKYEDAEKSYTTDGDGTKIIDADFFVTAAGEDAWKFAAKDDKSNEVNSGTFRTRRLVHYVEVKMKTLASIASNLTATETEMRRQGIQLVALPAVEMDHMPNIGSDAEKTTFETKARAAYSGSDGPSKAPYVIAVAYTDHLAVKEPDQTLTKSGVDVGPGKPDVEIPVSDGSQQYLWHDLVPGEGWFVSASFLKDGGAAGTDDAAIAAADCVAQPLNASNPDLWTKVKVKVSGLAAATGTITLKVHWVNRMRAGLSFSGNIVCLCTRAWWRNETTASQNQVAIHELGHQFGMVADGTGNGPDKVPTHYTGKGHRGPHCHNGLGVLASYAGVSGSGCVMFGETNGVTSFCADCTKALLKQDLSAGWTAF